MENQQTKQISNEMDSIRRAGKYLNIANNIIAMAYEESFEGEVDTQIIHAYRQAIIDATRVLSSIQYGWVDTVKGRRI